MNILVVILLIILLIIYIGQVIWIFKDTRKRQDELAVFWCFLSLISFPIVLIIYIILTRLNKGNNTCSGCGFKVKGSWKFCPNCNQELENNLIHEKYINIKRPLGGLPITIFIVGIFLFGTFLTLSLFNLKNSFKDVTVPATTIINLKHKGDYTIFYEYNNDDEASENYAKLKNMDISITNINSKNKVSIYKSTINSSYSYNGSNGGKAFLKFKIQEVGMYELNANSKISDNSKITISIVQGFVSKIVFIVLGSLVIMFATVLIGARIIIKRNNRV